MNNLCGLKNGERFWAGSCFMWSADSRVDDEKIRDMIELYREGKSDREIAEQTGTTISTVRAWRQYHKLPANDARKEVTYDRALMRQYYMRGMNDCQIAEILGCYSGTVGDWRKKEGLAPNKTRRRKKRTSE